MGVLRPLGRCLWALGLVCACDAAVLKDPVPDEGNTLDLQGENLSGSNLSGTNLSGVNLSGVNLGGTNLSGTNLSGTNLSGTNLGGNNLGGTNLSGTNLEELETDARALAQRVGATPPGEVVWRGGLPFVQHAPVPGASTDRPSSADPLSFDGAARESVPLEQTHDEWLVSFLRADPSSERVRVAGFPKSATSATCSGMARRRARA